MLASVQEWSLRQIPQYYGVVEISYNDENRVVDESLIYR